MFKKVQTERKQRDWISHDFSSSLFISEIKYLQFSTVTRQTSFKCPNITN